jgi:hypothetical protein
LQALEQHGATVRLEAGEYLQKQHRVADFASKSRQNHRCEKKAYTAVEGNSDGVPVVGPLQGDCRHGSRNHDQQAVVNSNQRSVLNVQQLSNSIP